MAKLYSNYQSTNGLLKYLSHLYSCTWWRLKNENVYFQGEMKKKSLVDITMLKNCILNHFLRDTTCTDLTLLSYHPLTAKLLQWVRENTLSAVIHVSKILDHIFNQWKQPSGWLALLYIIIFRTMFCEKKAYYTIWLHDISDDQLS